MKRILTILAAMCMVGSAMAQVPTITLSSGGKLQLFSAGQLGAAIDAANPNDTIYLSNGTFSGIPSKYNDAGYYEYLISKPLVIIGSGASTCTINLGDRYSNNQICINLNNSDGKFSLEGVSTVQEIDIVSEMDQFTMMNTKTTSLKIQAPLNSLTVDRCNISSDLRLNNKNDSISPVKNAYLRNSMLNDIHNSCDELCTVINCFVNRVDYSFIGYILNSVIYYAQNGDYATFDSCYSCNTYEAQTNCTKVSNDLVLQYASGQFDVANEWIGNDGTVVGVMGGNGPTYSLNPSYPTPDATKSTLEYDKVNKQLRIKVSLIEN